MEAKFYNLFQWSFQFTVDNLTSRKELNRIWPFYLHRLYFFQGNINSASVAFTLRLHSFISSIKNPNLIIYFFFKCEIKSFVRSKSLDYYEIDHSTYSAFRLCSEAVNICGLSSAFGKSLFSPKCVLLKNDYLDTWSF